MVGLTAALAVGGGSLYAQNGGGAADADVDIPMEKQAELSPQEMLDESDSLYKKMQEYLARIVQLQQIARKQKDVIKLNCVNDKLLQVKQLMNIAEAARTNLTEMIAREDEAGRYHEFGKIVIAEQQIRILAQEAETCIGEDLIFVGPTEVTVEEPEIPDDPTEGIDDDFVDIEPPGYASPFA